MSFLPYNLSRHSPLGPCGPEVFSFGYARGGVPLISQSIATGFSILRGPNTGETALILFQYSHRMVTPQARCHDSANDWQNKRPAFESSIPIHVLAPEWATKEPVAFLSTLIQNVPSDVPTGCAYVGPFLVRIGLPHSISRLNKDVRDHYSSNDSPEQPR